MADIGDEVFLIVIVLSELTGHEIQCVREVSHFIVARDSDFMLQIAGCKFLCPVHDLKHRPVGRERKEEQDEEGKTNKTVS